MIWFFFLHDYTFDCNILSSWQIILLLELCFLDIPHSSLLKSFSSLVELLKSLSTDTGDIFSKVCQLTLTTAFHNSPPHILCENEVHRILPWFAHEYQIKGGMRRIFVFWRNTFVVLCIWHHLCSLCWCCGAITTAPIILHEEFDLFQSKDPLSISDRICFVRWTRRPGISPSSQWCWEPGMWNPLTTMRTAVTRPPSMLALVLHHLKWSLMSAVRQRRGAINQ